MSRLFIELFLDEDVDVLVADLVRARGFNWHFAPMYTISNNYLGLYSNCLYIRSHPSHPSDFTSATLTS